MGSFYLMGFPRFKLLISIYLISCLFSYGFLLGEFFSVEMFSDNFLLVWVFFGEFFWRNFICAIFSGVIFGFFVVFFSDEIFTVDNFRINFFFIFYAVFAIAFVLVKFVLFIFFFCWKFLVQLFPDFSLYFVLGRFFSCCLFFHLSISLAIQFYFLPETLNRSWNQVSVALVIALICLYSFYFSLFLVLFVIPQCNVIKIM